VEEPVNIDVGNLPRVTYSMSLTALQNECKVRELKSYSTLPKQGLVGKLIEGTMCIGETREYQAYHSLLGLVEKEEAEKQAKKEQEREVERERSGRVRVELLEGYKRENREWQEADSRRRAEEAAFLERQREEAMKRKRKAEEEEAKFDESIGGPFLPKIINPSVSCKN